MNRKILRLLEVVILALIVFSGLAYAQNVERVIAYETLTVTSGAVKTLTSAVYTTSATKAFVTLEGPGDIRYTLDGTTPTTGDGGVGHELSAFGSAKLWLGAYELRQFKAIATLAAYDAVIKVTYFTPHL